ncbi:MAG: glycosyltransferase family 39 protein [Candidatus Eisenbacteria bacterium]
MSRMRWVARRVRVPRALRSPFLVSTSAALLARLLYLLEISNSVLLRLPVGDGRAYHEWGLAIARGDWLGQGVFYQAPLYPYFLGVLHAILGPSLWPARVAQAIIGALGVGAAAEAAAHFFGRRAAVLGGLLLAFYPPLVFYDGLIQKTVFDVALLSTLMFCLMRYDTHRTDRRALLAGVVFGLLCLTRANAILLFVAIVPWFLWRSIAPHATGVTTAIRLALRSPRLDQGHDLPRRIPHSRWGRSRSATSRWAGNSRSPPRSSADRTSWIGNNPRGRRALSPARGQSGRRALRAR